MILVTAFMGYDVYIEQAAAGFNAFAYYGIFPREQADIEVCCCATREQALMTMALRISKHTLPLDRLV